MPHVEHALHGVEVLKDLRHEEERELAHLAVVELHAALHQRLVLLELLKLQRALARVEQSLFNTPDAIRRTRARLE